MNKPEILIEQPTEAFADCWLAAARHLAAYFEGEIFWLKNELKPPFFEHLSFSLDKQIYFVRLSDVDGLLATPGMDEAVKYIAKGWDGIPCLMPMRRESGKWNPVAKDHGLTHAETNEPIVPQNYKPVGPVRMTAWELQDLGLRQSSTTSKRSWTSDSMSQSHLIFHLLFGLKLNTVMVGCCSYDHIWNQINLQI